MYLWLSQLLILLNMMGVKAPHYNWCWQAWYMPQMLLKDVQFAFGEKRLKSIMIASWSGSFVFEIKILNCICIVNSGARNLFISTTRLVFRFLFYTEFQGNTFRQCRPINMPWTVRVSSCTHFACCFIRARNHIWSMCVQHGYNYLHLHVAKGWRGHRVELGG